MRIFQKKISGVSILNPLESIFDVSFFLGPANLSAGPIGLRRLREIMRIFKKKSRQYPYWTP